MGCIPVSEVSRYRRVRTGRGTSERMGVYVKGGLKAIVLIIQIFLDSSSPHGWLVGWMDGSQHHHRLQDAFSSRLIMKNLCNLSALLMLITPFSPS